MSETLSVDVPEAARRLGVTERTVWRRLRGGVLHGRRVGRRVLVDVPAHVVAEAVVPYRVAVELSAWRPGPWPYTEDVVERHSRALLARRRAAASDMDRLAALSRPDPDGLSAVDYLRADRDGPDPADAPGDRR
ncbi:MAG: helix-turn-helix domain-containing protein [Chloroflexi bacterium]|nr:helix-turn-helix domain-containing protein [Chloroflexota bacterium]